MGLAATAGRSRRRRCGTGGPRRYPVRGAAVCWGLDGWDSGGRAAGRERLSRAPPVQRRRTTPRSQRPSDRPTPGHRPRTSPSGRRARKRLEDAVRLAVRAEQLRHDTRRHHDARLALDGMPWARLEQWLLLLYEGRVLVGQQPAPRALRGHHRRQGSTRRGQPIAGTHG